MTTTENPDDVVEKKPSKLPLILGLVFAVVGGGGGFFAVQSGVIPRGDSAAEHSGADGATAAADHGSTDDHGDGHGDAGADDHGATSALGGIAFVPLDPIVVSLPRSEFGSLLRFSAQLEVKPAYQSEIEALKPRVVDVLNGYLRAVKPDDLADPNALARLRAQMLRRVQIVVGEGRVNDVLIMEFVVN